MKLAALLIVASLGVLGVMVYQTVQQEFKLHQLKSGLLSSLSEVKTKETAINELKGRIKQLKESLSSINKNVNDLQMRKELVVKGTKDSDAKLKSCNKVKEGLEKKITDTEGTSVQLAESHKLAKSKAEQDIQSLKEKILQRDRSICAFADTTKEIVRRLCGML